MFRRFLIFSVFLPIFIPILAFAYTNPGSPRGFISDFANILKDNERQSLEDKLSNFEKKSSNEIAVATIDNLGDDTIEDFANKLFEEWGIGKKKKDNGVLILIALQDRKMRIEVGYGLEGALTDAQANWIINNIMKPAFRESNYYTGIDQAVDKIISATEGEYLPSEKTFAGGNRTPRKNTFFDYLEEFGFFGVFLFIWLASILGRSKSWWLGGVIGGIIAIIIGLLFGFLFIGLISLIILTPLGLLFDFIVSRSYQKSLLAGNKHPWWIGGGRGRSGGGSGFSGFSGGSSGGGGSSGSW